MVRRFSSFTVDTANQSIRRGLESIQLAPKAFSVLVYLVENPARIVTKAELLRAVWPETFVQEAVLKTCILDLRKALGDNPKQPKCIETVHRRGYRFVDTPLDAETGSVTSSQLLGRDQDLIRLRSLLDRAAEGNRQVVFVTGEPGIGKSTLIQYFLESSGVTRVLRGHCVEHFGAREAYYPVFDALTRAVRDASLSGLTGVLRTYAPSWLLEIPGAASAEEREALRLETVGATRERMLREITEAIEFLAGGEPLVIVLEDLHWSDLPTIDVISRIATRVETAKLLLIASYRPVEVTLTSHPVRALKQGLLAHSRCVELELKLLRRDDIRDMLVCRFARHDFPDTFAGVVHERTDGNPFFVINLLDFAASSEFIVEQNGTWRLKAHDLGIPDNLSQMIERQIERLTPQEQHILETASVVGRAFSVTLIAGDDPAQQDAHERSCDGMAKRNLFVRSAGVNTLAGNVSAQFQFTHALYRDVFYRRLSPIQHVRLHRIIGERLEAEFAGRLNEVASELAVHFQECYDLEKAIRYLELVAQRCVGRHALPEAADALAKALNLAETLPVPQRSAMTVDLTEQLGLVHRLTGQLGSAAAEFEKMYAQAPDDDRRLRAQLELASVSSWLDRDKCLNAVHKITELCGSEVDPALRSNAMGQVAYWNLLFRGWDERDARASHGALQSARATGNQTEIALHASRHAFFQTLSSQYLEACETAQEGIRMATAFDCLFDYSVGQYFESVALLYAGEWGRLRQRLRTAIDRATRNGHDLWVLLFSMVESFLHIEASSFACSQQACERNLASARALGHRLSIQISLILLGRAELGVGNLSAARKRFEEIRAWQDRERILMDWIWMMPLQLGLSELCLAEGDVESADAESARLLEITSRTAERTWIALGYYARGAVAAAKGDRSGVQFEVARGFAAIEGFTAPLAEWRLHALSGKAGIAKAQRVLRGLSSSLPEQDPLRDSLLSSPIMNSSRFASQSSS